MTKSGGHGHVIGMPGTPLHFCWVGERGSVTYQAIMGRPYVGGGGGLTTGE